MKLYVGNIPYSFTEEDLKNLFSEFGEVLSVAVIMDRETNRSKGFGFVELNDDDAKSAMEALEGKEVDGRNIKVNEARPMQPR